MNAPRHVLTSRRGMTLIEVLIVLALLAGLAGMTLTFIDDLDDNSRATITRERLDNIQAAIAGDGLEVGRFVSDMGRLPKVYGGGTEGQELKELWFDVQNVGQAPPISGYEPTLDGATFTDRISIDLAAGWHGPYLLMGSDKLFDGFGNPFLLYSDDAAGTVANAGEGIKAVGSAGRDPGDASGNTYRKDLSATTTASLTVRVRVRRRDDASSPVWGLPEKNVVIEDTPGAAGTTYAEGEVYVHSGGRVFVCGGGQLVSEGTPTPAWDTATAPGQEIIVRDTEATPNEVVWTYLGGGTTGYCQFMNKVKGVLFYPSFDGDGRAEIARTDLDESDLSGGEFSFTGLAAGTRKLLVYGGLIHNSTQTNCWSSGLQTIVLKPGGNVVTVYLTERLD